MLGLYIAVYVVGVVLAFILLIRSENNSWYRVTLLDVFGVCLISSASWIVVLCFIGGWLIDVMDNITVFRRKP